MVRMVLLLVDKNPIKEGDSMNEKKVKAKAVEVETVVESVAVSDTPEVASDGDADVAMNAEVMAIVEKAEPVEVIAFPSFFVDNSVNRVTVDVLSNPNTGKILSVSREGLGVDFSEFKNMVHTVAWFEFSAPTYEQLATYRQRSSVFRKELNQMIVDKIALRNYLIVWHLKGWSIAGADKVVIPLLQDKDGSLNEVSIKKVYSLQPVLLDVVLTIFEKDVLLN